jgi:hypothetical protein
VPDRKRVFPSAAGGCCARRPTTPSWRPSSPPSRLRRGRLTIGRFRTMQSPDPVPRRATEHRDSSKGWPWACSISAGRRARRSGRRRRTARAGRSGGAVRRAVRALRAGHRCGRPVGARHRNAVLRSPQASDGRVRGWLASSWCSPYRGLLTVEEARHAASSTRSPSCRVFDRCRSRGSVRHRRMWGCGCVNKPDCSRLRRQEDGRPATCGHVSASASGRFRGTFEVRKASREDRGTRAPREPRGRQARRERKGPGV